MSEKQTIHDNRIKVYRYKFTSEIMNQLMAFAKLHQYDDRKSFKEAWELWLNISQSEVNIESNRLIALGYKGNVPNKMFKAARYYFRTKSTNEEDKQEENNERGNKEGENKEKGNNENNENNENNDVKKRSYINLSSEILEAIDLHISRNLNNIDYSPATGYDNFNEISSSLIKNEIKEICNDYTINEKACKQKFKKAYKNRYFQYIRKLQQTN